MSERARARQAAPPRFVVRRRTSAPLAELAYEAVAEAIFDGNLAAGARIGIDSLAADLEMSITPVREALSRLLAQRLILSQANRGYLVASALTAVEFDRLFQARRVLEYNGLVESLPGTTRAADLAQARANLAATLAADAGPGYRGYAGFARADMRFHEHLVGLAGNVFLVDAWRGLNFHLHVSRLYGRAGVIDLDAAGVEHERIVDALASGGRDQFLAAVGQHIDQAHDRLRILAR